MSRKVITRILVVVNLILIGILVFILWIPTRSKKEVAEARVFFARGISALPYWVAQDKGYFDSLQIKVKGDEIPRVGDEIDMVGRGTIILGVGVPWDALIGKATSALPKFRVVYSCFGTPDKPATALVARRDAGINSLSDLTGHRIGYLQDTRANLEVPAILASLGVDTAGIKMAPLSSSEVPTAFIDNRCEAMVVLEPMRSFYLADTDNVMVLEDGFLEKHLAPGGRLPVSVSFTSVANFKLRNKTSVKLIKALDMAVEDIKADPAYAKKIAAENLGLPEGLDFPIPEFRKYSEEDPQTIVDYITTLRKMSVVLFEVPDLKDLYIRAGEIK